MPKLNLDAIEKKEEFYEVRYDGKDYRIPLSGNINYKQYVLLAKAQETNSIDDIIAFLAQFLGKEVTESLGFNNIKRVFIGWQLASDGEEGDLTSKVEAGELTTGES